ncbi:hypothetical protein VP01_697g6 [Puccinia sorghi]|uniref:Uncharacterized protein n=1 Tax=Puccinia sorghi TaxID=27349 RepID=A0A0L6UET9_9BASI|nr:hypothetical protein VP01_697g6 [Puccinia sorghi]
MWIEWKAWSDFFFLYTIPGDKALQQNDLASTVLFGTLTAGRWDANLTQFQEDPNLGESDVKT